MGLYIVAYKGLRKVENPKFDSNGELENEENQIFPRPSRGWFESDWAWSEELIETDMVDETVMVGKADTTDEFDKVYEVDTVYEFEDSFEFKAGSYFGYILWCEDLDRFKGDVAFQELIDFSDIVGVIGSELSAKLRDDFIKYHDEAMEFAKGKDVCMYFFERYCYWEKAFTMAAENGAVEFC